MAGVNKELWTGIVKRVLQSPTNFLEKIPSMDNFVKNDVIHINEIITEVDVLEGDEVTYPIPTQEYQDNDIAVSLVRMVSKVTPITLDRLYSISYKVIEEATKSHTESLLKRIAMRALFNHAPATSNDGIVVPTTGADDGKGFKRLTLADLRSLAEQMDDANIPTDNRVLVLESSMITDLLLLPNVYINQYNNIPDGRLLGYFYGFHIYEFTARKPVYTLADGVYTRSTFNTPPANKLKASIGFHADNSFKALGTTEFYPTPPTSRNHQYEMNFRQYHLCMPLRAKSYGAIVKVPVA